MSASAQAVSFVLLQVLQGLGRQEAKEWVDDMLDKAEDKIAASPTKFDDVLLLPMINILRARYNIPDDIGGDPD